MNKNAKKYIHNNIRSASPTRYALYYKKTVNENLENHN